MAPKKGKKISLNEFLGDSGSWADEMDSLPSAPAVRTDDEQGVRSFHNAPDRGDRGYGPPRDDVPLPTQPPYTAFIGNLAFDLTEPELEDFFGASKTKSIKIIKDREEKPKGFGYVEFEDLEGLKNALSKSGSNFSGRTIRVSVAEPPKERSGFGGSFDDDSKFDNPWRRDGPPPDLSNSRDGSRRRFDGPPPAERSLPSLSEEVSDWRSSRPARPPPVEPEAPTFKRKGSGFFAQDGQTGAADKEEVWTMGSKFKPAGPSEDTAGSKFGSVRRNETGIKDPAASDDGDWRSAARPRPAARSSTSPTSSTPPTPQLNRRKLELLPRSGPVSATPSPLSSPKIGPTPPVAVAARASPFGAARPVDVTSREKEVAERLEKDREVIKDKITMSRTNSRAASERSPLNRARTPPPGASVPASPKPSITVPTLAPNVRPTLSFANVAAKKENATKPDEPEGKTDIGVDEVTKEVADIVVG